MKMVKLNQLCEINIGKTPSRGEPSYWGKGVKWISISDLKERYITETKEQITQEAIDKCNMKIIPSNTVIMSFKLTIGKVAITEEESFSNEAIANFPILDSTKLIPEYLYYALQTLDFTGFTDRAVMGATLNKAKLNELKIPLIDLNKQYRIVQLLDKAQELIDKRKEQIEACDKLLKGLFYDMFGEVINDKKTYMELDVVCNFIDYRGKTPDKSEVGIPLITAKNVKANRFSKEPQEFIPEGNYESVMTRGIPRVNDVIFTTEAPLGNVCRIPNIYSRFAVGQRIIVMQPKEKILNSEYLEYALSTEEFRNSMFKRSSGSTVTGIRSKELVKLSIPIPKLSLQNSFSEKLNLIEQQKQVMQQSLIELENNFNSLMQRTFKGELF